MENCLTRKTFMPKIVHLQDIVDVLDGASEESEAFVDLESGEIIHITEDDRRELDADDWASVPEWQREHLATIRELLGTERLAKLPGSYDIHEWSIMERFCGTVANQIARQQLFDSIHGTGAFRMFHNTLEQFRLKEEWYAYRQSALEEIAREWLDENGIPYE